MYFKTSDESNSSYILERLLIWRLEVSTLSAYEGRVNVALARVLEKAGLLAAITSTSSAFISLGTAAIVRDLPRALKREIAYGKQIFWGRIVTILLTLFALLFGYFGGYLVAILGALGWGYFASALVPILAIGLNWKRATRKAAITGLSIALGLNIVFLILEQIFKFKMPYGMPSYVLVLPLSLLAIISASFITKSASEDEIDSDIRAAMKL